MSAEQIIGFSLAVLVMMTGVMGSFLPVLPGVPLVLAAAIGHRLYFGATSVSNLVLIILILLTGLSILFDYLASTLGAKKMGATWRGMLGAILGAIVGLFFNIPGILVGPFIGAFLFELVGGYEFKKSLRAGVGAFLGLVAGAIGKFAIALIMLTLFVVNVLYRSSTTAG